MNSFETLVIEKLDAIEARIASIEQHLAFVVNEVGHHGQRISERDQVCLENHTSDHPSPLPRAVNEKW